jgi:hypothetical protein
MLWNVTKSAICGRLFGVSWSCKLVNRVDAVVFLRSFLHLTCRNCTWLLLKKFVQTVLPLKTRLCNKLRWSTWRSSLIQFRKSGKMWFCLVILFANISYWTFPRIILKRHWHQLCWVAFSFHVVIVVSMIQICLFITVYPFVYLRVFCRDAITNQLSSLDCRISSSEDDVLSADDLESVADEVYEPTDSDSAITDMSDAQTTPGLYVLCCLRHWQLSFVSFFILAACLTLK